MYLVELVDRYPTNYETVSPDVTTDDQPGECHV